MNSYKSQLLSPASVTLAFLLLIIGVVLAGANGDPLALARLGTRFSLGDPNGSEGYDGQFVYYIARDLQPERVRSYLDVPAYRFQRILLPLLAWLITLGRDSALPWALAGLGLLSHIAGTWIISALLAIWGVNRWYAITYGLWVGFTLGVRLALPEPLAFALVAGAILSVKHNRRGLGAVLYGLAAFAKEVALIFLAAQLLVAIFQRDRRFVYQLALFAIAPYVLFQAWLWMVFGTPGIGSGGANATPFEAIPFLGLIRIGFFSPILLLGTLIVFGPSIVLPTIWGIWTGLRALILGRVEFFSLALLLNALIIPFVPFSTFREPGGLVRLASGLILSVLLYAARQRAQRVLNYSLFLVVLNVFLLK